MPTRTSAASPMPIGLSRTKQLLALASPVRARLAQLLDVLGPSSVTELSTRVGRSHVSLYYHLTLMEQAGVIRRVGTAPSGRRPRTVYELVNTRIAAVPRRDSPSDRKAMGRTATAFLRLAQRQYEAGIEDRARTAADLPKLVHYELRLTADVNRRLKKLLNDLDQLVSESERKPRGTPWAVTIVLAPIDVRAT